MSDDEIAKYRAGHAERMKVAQARVDKNLREHEAFVVRDANRTALVARIEKLGGEVHEKNCCWPGRVDLPPAIHPGGSINIDLSEMGHGDGSDPELLVLETIALVLEAYRA